MVLVHAHRPKRFPIPLNHTAAEQSLLSSAAGSNSNGGRSSPLSSVECFSVKAHAGSPRPAVSCSPASSGNGEKGHEGGNTRHQQENKEGEEEEKEELGPRFDQPRRLQILRALTRDRGAAPTPDSLPQAVRGHVTYLVVDILCMTSYIN